MTEGQPSRPANILNIVAINQGALPLSMEVPVPPAYSPAETQKLLDKGYLLLDTRDYQDFCAGHIPGAINIQRESTEFEQRVGWVIPEDIPLIAVLRAGDSASDVTKALAFIGLEKRVAGFLEGGMDAWAAARLPTSTVTQISPADLYNARKNGGPNVLDVREPDEWNEGHIEGAINLSYKRLEGELDRLSLQPDQPIAISCAGGFRSTTAASILRRHGYSNVINMTGGMDAWRDAGLPRIDGQGIACK